MRQCSWCENITCPGSTENTIVETPDTFDYILYKILAWLIQELKPTETICFRWKPKSNCKSVFPFATSDSLMRFYTAWKDDECTTLSIDVDGFALVCEWCFGQYLFSAALTCKQSNCCIRNILNAFQPPRFCDLTSLNFLPCGDVKTANPSITWKQLIPQLCENEVKHFVQAVVLCKKLRSDHLSGLFATFNR